MKRDLLSNKQLFFLIATICILLILPIVIYTNSHRQNIGSKAAGNTITFTPTALSSDIPNSYHGMYEWQGQNIAPVTTIDSYDRFKWSDIETTQGTYDFSKIDAALANAQSRGGKYGLRIYALWDGHGSFIPSYLMNVMPHGYWYDFAGHTQTGCDPVLGGGTCDTYVPDWNDPTFLARTQARLI